MKIGGRELKLPILQGGMGIGVSLGRLAGNVASYGAMGTISAVGIGYREADFGKNNVMANRAALEKEIKKAKDIAKGQGLLAVNIMHAITQYEEMVKTAIQAGIDVLVVGAGLPLDLPKLVQGWDGLLAPIVSSKRALELLYRSWKKRFQRVFDMVILEGSQAGGHLGVQDKEIQSYDLLASTREVKDFLREVEKKEGVEIPLFVAGNALEEDTLISLIQAGADGCQLGTPFILTEECDAHENFKEVIRQAAEEDVVLLHSPVGMPARAINTPFVQKLTGEKIKIMDCMNCLKTCNPKETEFCISRALIQAAKGNREEGLFFAGAGVGRLNQLRSVKEVLDEACLYLCRAGSTSCCHGEGSL